MTVARDIIVSELFRRFSSMTTATTVHWYLKALLEKVYNSLD